MKNLRLLLPAFSLIALTAMAQVSNDAPAASSGGLAIDARTDEERIQFLIEVAAAYFRENDFASAIGVYERILEIDPDNQEARYISGHVYISAKEYAKAEAVLTGLIRDFPEDFKLLNNLAWLYATAEDPAFRNGQKAIDLAQEAMVLAPNDHHVWSTLAEAHYINGEYERAYNAITHMAQLATRYGTNITKEMVDGYNEQIRKCKRAMDLEKTFKEESAKGTEAAQ